MQALRVGTFAVLLTASVGAWAGDLDTDTQGWSAVAVAGPVRKDARLLLWYDAHARHGDDISNLGVTLSRPALGWRATPKLDLRVGYAWVVSRSSAGRDTTDRRLWQQATYPLGGLLGRILARPHPIGAAFVQRDQRNGLAAAPVRTLGATAAARGIFAGRLG